jgi:hypothetical protein
VAVDEDGGMAVIAWAKMSTKDFDFCEGQGCVRGYGVNAWLGKDFGSGLGSRAGHIGTWIIFRESVDVKLNGLPFIPHKDRGKDWAGKSMVNPRTV